MTKQSCKTCAYFDVPPDADGKIRVRKEYYYRCTAPVPDLKTILPEAITRAWGFRQPTAAGQTTSTYGGECPGWEDSKKGPSDE